MMYFDYASTTPISNEVLTAYTKVLTSTYGNADSLHDLGRDAQRLMEKSRAQIAQLLFVDTQEIMFTSCASEANNYAIKAFALANQKRGKHIITSCVEHSSVLHTCEQLQEHFGFEVTYLPITKEGVVSVESLREAIRKDTILVSIMHVNNETGAINPIQELAKCTHAYSRAMFHSDCVQALGKLTMQYKDLDMATFSAHKVYGLKGSAILYVKKNVALLPLISGGQQEHGIRGGTSNAPVNIVFAKTLRMTLQRQDETYNHVQELHTMLRNALKELPNVVINSPMHALPHFLNVSFLNIGSEIMLNALNERGICVSAQSTCASRSKARSYVLLAMGLGEEVATHAIRISISHLTTKQEVQQLIEALKEINHDYKTR